MTSKKDRRGLGRGLSALMADVGADEAQKAEAGDSPVAPDRMIPIDKIFANPDQPRRDFDRAALDDLANSIRQKGIIQPLILRPDPQGKDSFQIVAGERRWRAAQIAQLHEVPAIVRDFDNTEVLEIAIIENIQRADLNPMEEAAGYRQLMDRFGHTQEQMSTALGKSRSHIANMLRLLQLPQTVQAMLRAGALSVGHARALITSENAEALARKVVANGLSVRETEKLVKAPRDSGKPARPRAAKDADTRALEGDLAAHLGMGVSIDHGAAGEGGRLTVRYRTLDDLDTLCALLSGNRG